MGQNILNKEENMRKLTKWIVCLFAVVLAISCTSLIVFAAENDALSLSAPESVKTGDTVIITVNAEVADLVTDGVLVVTYDQELLSYVDAAAGSAWSETADLSLADNCKAADGTVTLAFAAVDAAAKGDIIVLEFTALKEGAATVAIDAESSKLSGTEGYDLGAELTFNVEARTSFTVTFVDGLTEETLATVTVEGGNAATAPTVENHDGYYFLGWDKDFSYVTADLTVTAVFCLGEDGCPAEKFTDVNYKAWYHEGVDYALDHGYLVGMTDTTFGPNVNTNRAMIVTILYRMAGSPAVADVENPFTDVAESAYYYDAVLWAYSNGITSGMSATTFCPNYNLTREQLVTFLFNYAKYEGYDVSIMQPLSNYGYEDLGDVSAWAYKAMSWAVEKGLVTGMTQTTLEPAGLATRAQIARLTMLIDQKFKA